MSLEVKRIYFTLKYFLSVLLNYYGLPTAFSKPFKALLISGIRKAAETELCDVGCKSQFCVAACWLTEASSFLEASRENLTQFSA